MSAYTPTTLDNKPGSLVSWVLPILVIVVLIGFLSFVVSKEAKGDAEHPTEKPHH